jgi:hypothetical protein
MVCPSKIEEEQNRLADEWLDIDTHLSLEEYVLHHGSKELKEYYESIAGINDEGEEE